MLLYPSTGQDLNEAMIVQGHRIRVATVDLGRKWEAIETRLLDLLAVRTNPGISNRPCREFEIGRICRMAKIRIDPLVAKTFERLVGAVVRIAEYGTWEQRCSAASYASRTDGY
jgi:hypothetical protein